MRFERITVNPNQMGGMPCIRALRIPVATVVAMVADGMTTQEIVGELPDLEPDDVAGAVRRYGGVAKPIGGTQYCALFAPPQAPAGLTLAYVVAAGTVATATIPEPARLSADESPVIWSQLLLWRYPNVCPPDAGAGAPQAIRNTGYGPQSIPIDASPPRGTWCYAVALIDGLGRRTVASAANVTVP